MFSLTINNLRDVSISASDSAPEVFGSMMYKNIWQLNANVDLVCSISWFQCKLRSSLEEKQEQMSSIKVSVILEQEML